MLSVTYRVHQKFICHGFDQICSSWIIPEQLVGIFDIDRTLIHTKMTLLRYPYY